MPPLSHAISSLPSNTGVIRSQQQETTNTKGTFYNKDTMKSLARLHFGQNTTLANVLWKQEAKKKKAKKEFDKHVQNT